MDASLQPFALAALKVLAIFGFYLRLTMLGCAASVRSDLEKIDGVENIETDTANRVASFSLTKSDVDYKTKLEEFAKTNTHLKGYEIQ